MMVSPSVIAMLIEFALPLFALMMIQIALNTAFSKIFASHRSYTSGSSFNIRENNNSLSVVPLIWSNKSSLR